MTSAWIARIGLAFVFIYHGLVPKLLWVSAGERAMIRAHGIDSGIHAIARSAGLVEIAIGLAVLALPKRRWPLYLVIVALVALLIDTAFVSPERLVQAFGPLSTNVAAIALALVALREVPESAGIAKA